MKTIAILGAGQIGSRHLQGLAKLRLPVHLQVFDPSEAALATARERFAQAMGPEANPNIQGVDYISDFSRIEEKLDLAIVATAANVRRELTEKLLNRYEVKNLLLEKIVFQRARDFSEIGAMLAKKQVKTWVNCALRLWPVYEKLAAQKCTNLQFHATGSNWGIGCNAIHYLDLFYFLTGAHVESFSLEGLDAGFVPSKRANYREITGTLRGHSPKGSALFTSWRTGQAPVTVQLQSESFQCLIREDLQKMWLADAASGWQPREESFPMPYQSQLTGRVAEEILEKGTTILPDFAVAAKSHLAFLAAISQHLGLKGDDPCPIT